MSDEYKPVTRDDVTDDKLAVGEVRALRAEMRLWFELVLGRFDRTEGRIAALEQHRGDANGRLDDHEQRLAALEAVLNKET